MNVTQLILTSFRNYTSQTVDFCPSLNVIEGANTAGKTNLVEAVYLCGVGKSPRAGKDKEMILFAQTEAHVTLYVQKKYRSHRIDVHLLPNGKRISIDGAPIAKMSELMGILNVVFFAPDELKIVKDDPTQRRRFINISLCQQNPSYYAALSRYNRILENRNAVIKEAHTLQELRQNVAVWDEQLAQEGAKIVVARHMFLQTLQSIADPIHRAIAGQNCDLVLSYHTEANQYDEVMQALLAKLRASGEREMALRYTVCGPHRDDFAIMSQQKDLRTFGSQGQQRTAALALKLAEIAYFEQNTGEKPVLLLDDVLSELDPSRREALLRATEGIQTLLTCTDFTENQQLIGKRIIVNQGTIEA